MGRDGRSQGEEEKVKVGSGLWGDLCGKAEVSCAAGEIRPLRKGDLLGMGGRRGGRNGLRRCRGRGRTDGRRRGGGQTIRKGQSSGPRQGPDQRVGHGGHARHLQRAKRLPPQGVQTREWQGYSAVKVNRQRAEGVARSADTPQLATDGLFRERGAVRVAF